MVDLLIAILITGCAVTFVIELLDLTIIGGFFTRQQLNVFFAMPLSVGGIVLLLPLSWQFLVVVPAATFVSLALGKLLNKPQFVSSSRLPRL